MVKDDGDGVPRDRTGCLTSSTSRLISATRSATLEGRRLWERLARGIRHRTVELLDRGREARDDVWRCRSTPLSDGNEQRGSALHREPAARALCDPGTELKISPLLDGIRSLSGEKIQWYLASELRDRIRATQVRVTVVDKLARKQYEVEPRQFEGRLLHQLPAVRSPFGEAYAELYLTEPVENGRSSLPEVGTRVIEDIGTLPGLERGPWRSGYLQGLIDVPYLNLTPSTRSGVVHDERYGAVTEALVPLEAHLNGLIDAQPREC